MAATVTMEGQVFRFTAELISFSECCIDQLGACVAGNLVSNHFARKEINDSTKVYPVIIDIDITLTAILNAFSAL